jgi:hypothetical protein
VSKKKKKSQQNRKIFYSICGEELTTHSPPGCQHHNDTVSV